MPSHDQRIVMHLHGGGYVGGSPEIELAAATPVAAALGLTGCCRSAIRLWWRSGPPADVDRVVAVYRELRKEHHAGSIALMGWSAGGGLALRSTLKLQQLGRAIARPCSHSPRRWTDVTGAGDTFRTLMPYDILDGSIIDTVRELVGSEEALRSSALLTHLRRLLLRLSADHHRHPAPRDALLSDCARLQRKLTDANVENELRVF